jgi:phosphoadenosine phosphosulfate reductase
MKSKVKIAKNIIESVLNSAQKPAIFWTGGKDSTLLLRLLMDFNSKIDVIFLDSGKEFPEVYGFMEKLAKEWNFDYHTFKYGAENALVARQNKIKAIKNSTSMIHCDSVFVGIRWDEHKSRSEELFLRDFEGVLRVHPILHLTEDDVWTIIKSEKIPYCKLYDEGYRSLGEAPFTHKSGKSERSGRDQDKEEVMNKLRKLGYF